jgi:putative ATPase
MSPRTPRPSAGAQLGLRAPGPKPPLAARMRPRVLDEVIGQAHLIGPGRLLRRAVEADRLSSLIFAGPPGTGKTTLARVIAGHTQAAFAALNAVLAGVKDIRDAVEAARELRDLHGRRTLLFVDEVHRFNKSQQDALLPWVEDGTVIFIGATTENPWFEVNKALVSRSRVFQLQPLTPAELSAVLDQALGDAERGYGGLRVRLHADARAHLVDVCGGDARTLLNALELAVESTAPGGEGELEIPLSVAEESIQRRAILYDKEGDAHFDTISAFIKSVRGSDPDAALYWLARMIQGGEDPRFLLRRLVILAAEDVGLADPQALVHTEACAAAFARVGLPEGRFHLAQATLYLCLAPKSNSTMGLFDAIFAVEAERAGEVPAHLKDPSRDGAALGHGEGYLYPHAWKDHWVAQQYLPEALKGRLFYAPSALGWEGERGPALARRREAQLAAMVEAPPERLTTGPADPARERWLQRTASQAGERLAAHRDAIFAAVVVQRHHVVLDLDAGAGLLTWEALRRAPEGAVYAWCPRPAEAVALAALAARLPELDRPQVIEGPPEALPTAMKGARAEVLVGREALTRAPDPAALAAAAAAALAPGGRLALLEPLARHTQRLHALVDGLPAGLAAAWATAEDALYADPTDPRTRWDADGLCALLGAAGLSVEARMVDTRHALQVTEAVAARWFEDRPGSYGDRLKAPLGAAAVHEIGAAVRRALVGRAVPWAGRAALLVGGAA